MSHLSSTDIHVLRRQLHKRGLVQIPQLLLTRNWWQCIENATKNFQKSCGISDEERR